MMLHRHFDEKRKAAAVQEAAVIPEGHDMTEAPAASEPEAPAKEPVKRSGRTKKTK